MENVTAKAHLPLILLASGFFIFWGLGSYDLLDPDQGMWGDIMREMVKGGDWITPHFDGVRYLEKPPLYFWFSAAAASLFGPSEWVARLGSALPAFGTALLTYRFGRLFYGATAALASALVMMSSLGTLRYARLPLPDFLLVFSVTLALYAFCQSGPLAPPAEHASQRAIDWRLSPLFYAGAALAVLSKGLIGLVFPTLIAAAFLLISGERATWRRLHLVKGFAVFSLIALPWHILAAAKNTGFLWFYLVDNQFLRFLNSRAYLEDDVPLTTLAFLGNVALGLFPWTFVTLAALREALPHGRSMASRSERIRLFIGLWVLAVIGFFSLSSSKLEHYYLPAIVPLSLIAGKLFADAIESGAPAKNLKWSMGLAAALFSIAGAALLFFARGLTPDRLLAALAQTDVYYRSVWTYGFEFPVPLVAAFGRALCLGGVVLIAGFPAASALIALGRPKAAFATLLAVAGLVGVLTFRIVLLLQPLQTAKPAAEVLSAASKPEDAIVFEGDLSYGGGIPYYTGRQVYVLNGRRGDLEFGSYYPEARELFLDDPAALDLWKGGRRIFFVTRFSPDRSFSRKPPAGTVFLLGRYGAFSIYSNRPGENR